MKALLIRRLQTDIPILGAGGAGLLAALHAPTYTRVRLREGNLTCDAASVRFTRVRPGESLLAA